MYRPPTRSWSTMLPALLLPSPPPSFPSSHPFSCIQIPRAFFICSSIRRSGSPQCIVRHHRRRPSEMSCQILRRRCRCIHGEFGSASGHVCAVLQGQKAEPETLILLAIVVVCLYRRLRLVLFLLLSFSRLVVGPKF